LFVTEEELNVGISYAIMNVLGQEVAKGKMDTTTIAVDQLPAGVYYLQLRSTNLNSSLKFVKE